MQKIRKKRAHKIFKQNLPETIANKSKWSQNHTYKMANLNQQAAVLFLFPFWPKPTYDSACGW